MANGRTNGMHVGRNSAGRWVVWDNHVGGTVLSPDFGTKREATDCKRSLAKAA